jgi:hypothetical protein
MYDHILQIPTGHRQYRSFDIALRALILTNRTMMDTIYGTGFNVGSTSEPREGGLFFRPLESTFHSIFLFRIGQELAIGGSTVSTGQLAH